MADNDVQVTFGADISGLDSGVKQAQSSLDSLKVSAKDFSSALTGVGGNLDKLTPSMLGAGDAASKIGTAAKMAAADSAVLGTGMAGVTRELIVLGREGISGNFSRLPGSLMVLSNRLQGVGAEAVNAKTVFTLLGSIGKSLFNPWILGIVGVTAGLDLLFRAFRSGFKSADEELQRHKAFIQEIRDAYGEAGDAATKYSGTSQAVLQFEGKEDLKATQQQLQAQLTDFANAITSTHGQSLVGMLGPDADKLRGIMAQFIQDVQNGKANVLDFRDAIAQIGLASDNAKIDATVQKWMDETEALRKLAVQAGQTVGALHLLTRERDAPDESETKHAPTAKRDVASSYLASDNAIVSTEAAKYASIVESARSAFTDKEDLLRHELAMHQITAAQEAAGEKAALQTELQATLDGLDKEVAATVAACQKELAVANLTATQRVEIENKITKAKQDAEQRRLQLTQDEHEKELELDRHLQEQQLQGQDQAWNGFFAMINSAAQQSASFGDFFKHIVDDMVVHWVEGLEQMVAKWLAEQGVLQSLGFLGDIISLGFGVPALDTGAWQVPHDMLAMIHQDEMVVPKEPANALRTALSGGGSQPGTFVTGLDGSAGGPSVSTSAIAGGGSAGGGDVHVHLHVESIDTRSGGEWMKANADRLAAVVGKQIRLNHSSRSKNWDR